MKGKEMIVFCDKKTNLVDAVTRAIKQHKLKGIKAEHGNIMKKRGLIVSASNPSFTTGGGLDALIAKKYPSECEKARKHPGKNQKVGKVLFTVTVDHGLGASRELIEDAILFAKRYAKNNRVLLCGLGTGIGGLEEGVFVETLVGVLEPKKKGRKPKNIIKQWKFLREGFKSQYGNMVWKGGKWYTHTGNVLLCSSGFHASSGIQQAFSYVQGEILAEVECAGNHRDDSDGTKSAWEKMRIIKAYSWEKKDSVALAIFAAELCIANYEKVHPNDDKPRKAIEAARTWLKNPCKKTEEAAARSAESAARSAAWSAAWSVESAARSAARSAAWSAARSAESAARSAESAAWSAARSAESAAWSAESAAWSAESAAWSAESAARLAARSAARSALLQKIEDWIQKRVKTLKVIYEEGK